MSKKVSWIIIVGKNINNGKEWKKLAKKKQKNKKQIRENLETCEICWINWILYVGTQNLNNSPEFVRVVFNIISATLVLCGEHMACNNILKVPQFSQFWNREVIFRCK